MFCGCEGPEAVDVEEGVAGPAEHEEGEEDVANAEWICVRFEVYLVS